MYSHCILLVSLKILNDNIKVLLSSVRVNIFVLKPQVARFELLIISFSEVHVGFSCIPEPDNKSDSHAVLLAYSYSNH